MKKIVSIILICQLFVIPGSVMALEDQGLNSIISIIDKALEDYFTKIKEVKAYFYRASDRHEDKRYELKFKTPCLFISALSF